MEKEKTAIFNRNPDVFSPIQSVSRSKSNKHFDEIIGNSREMHEIYDLIERVANTDSTVLITGESGTGKELIAKAIHYNSSRISNELITVNCGAIPEELLESELFGHIKGAFTGAINNRKGRFESADGGTIFLDEIGDMSLRLQVKLLRVLQEKKFEPVGSSKTVSVNVRILAASNQNLELAVKEKRFREDLFYRLNVIPVKLPPLRLRRGDIPFLITHFIEKFNSDKKRAITGISAESMTTLVNYNWPGNVRELENLIERMVILKGEGEIKTVDLPDGYFKKTSETFSTEIPYLQLPETGLDVKRVIGEMENNLLYQALERTNWNRNRAANLLGLNRTTLVEKLKKKQIKRPVLA